MKITKRSVRYFTLLKLPLVYFSGIRITNINADGVEASVKLKWINQNPFRSMFWAVQGMAAELTCGVLHNAVRKHKSAIAKRGFGAMHSFHFSQRKKVCLRNPISFKRCKANRSGRYPLPAVDTFAFSKFFVIRVGGVKNWPTKKVLFHYRRRQALFI